MRVFVTGGTGFAGSHLIDVLLQAGHDVTALVHRATTHQQLPAAVQIVEGDLLDLPALKSTVTTLRPNAIYHLAGQASPGLSWKTPGRTLAVNTIGTTNVLEAALAAGKPRVLVVTSADIYGKISSADLPLTEKTPPAPRHPYGISKWAAGEMVRVYWQRYQLPAIEARPFNHIGPRQMLGFVAPDFASQIAAIKLGQKPPEMSVGNLKAERDFTDVRDVVRAYCALVERGQPGQNYLICSGQPVSIHYLLNVLLEIAGIDINVDYDAARMRPSDTPVLYGDFARLRRDTGWMPAIHLRQSLANTLAEWLGKLKVEN